MHIKFLKHGTGSGQRAVDYLLGDLDHTGKVRAGVRVLRGHPQQLADVIDSLTFVHRYTSGVVAWGSDDSPTEAQLDQFIDDFEKVAFAGLDAQRYCWTVIEHRDDQCGVHLHVLSARVDLETGQSLNIAPPGWQKSFDPLRDFYNFKHGWTRPDDPARARLLQPGHHAFKEAAAVRQGLEVEPDPKALITDFLVSRIELGLIDNRDDILTSLLEIGDITRTGKNYISIKPEGFDRAIRLKGVIYEKQFSAAAFREPQAQVSAGPEASRGPDTKRADAACTELQHAIKRRAEYNTERYPAKPAVSEQPSSAAALGSSEEQRNAENQFQQLLDSWSFFERNAAHFGARLVPQVPRREDTASSSNHSARTTAARYAAALQHSDYTQQHGHGISAVSRRSAGAQGISEPIFSGPVVAASRNEPILTTEVNQHEYRNPDPTFQEDSGNRDTVQSTRSPFDCAIRAAERATAEISRATRKFSDAIKHIATAIAQRIRIKDRDASECEALKLEHSSQQSALLLAPHSRSGPGL